MSRPDPGTGLLVVWAAGITHMAGLIEAAYREGFGAAQMGAADCSDAWNESMAKAARDGNLNHADWAMRVVD